MDSILGKTISAILVLIAVALVAVAFFVSYEHDRTSNLVAAVGSTELNIKGDYVHSPTGYTAVTNASVISAGEAPGTIIKNGQLVSPWGAPITITPIDASRFMSMLAIHPMMPPTIRAIMKCMWPLP